MSETAERRGPSRPREALQRSITWYLRQLSRVLDVLSDEELERLLPLLTERRFRPRQVIFAAGQPADRVYLLLKGRVKVFQVADNGKEVILEVVTRGGIVGDMAIVEEGERTATAQALEEAVALSISWADFSHVVQQSPRLGFAMAELMARRLSRMQQAFANIVAKPVSARLADVLLGREAGGLVRLGLTHQELAQSIGTSRETVTALLTRFCAMGAMEPAADSYFVRDPALLLAIARGDVAVSPRHPVGTSPANATAT